MKKIEQLGLQKSFSLVVNKRVKSNIRYKTTSISNNRSIQRCILTSKNNSTIEKSINRTTRTVNPYQSFVRQLKIQLPSPKDKFYQSLRILPFNRSNKHIELITLFLKKYSFFKMHPDQLIIAMAKKIIIIQQHEISEKLLVILDEGQCYYKKKLIKKGTAIYRHQFIKDQFEPQVGSKYIGLNWYEYRIIISEFIENNIQKFKKFLTNVQIFKIFTTATFEKLSSNLTLYFLNKNQTLCQAGSEAHQLFVVFSGSISRRVIVQIDRINKIPVKKYSKLIKVLTKSYEHKIVFNKQDLVGINELLQGRKVRKEVLSADEDAIIIGIDRSIIEQNMDEYVNERLLQYNHKKYPNSYEDLCADYMKTKMQAQRNEQRKISALSRRFDNNLPKTRMFKIERIINMYENRIRSMNKLNLLSGKKQQRLVHDH